MPMSLRLRIVAAIALVVVLGSAASLGVAGWRSKLALREELSAAMSGGRQTVVSAFEDLSRSDHPERDLRQLVATFDGNRHLIAVWTDGRGRLAARSHPRSASPAPPWFASALATRAQSLSMPAPVAGRGAILLKPEPAGDIGVLWRELLDLAAVFTVSLAIGAAGVWLLVGRALRPLAHFSDAFTRIGGGDYAARVGQPGPLELARLGQGIDEMAARLGAMQSRNRTLEEQIERLQEEERADLARDLHDEIGPQLFAANIDAANAKALLAEGRGDQARDRLTAIQSALGHAQALVRDILGRLRPVDLIELGLAPAIEGLARFWQSRRPEIRFDIGVTVDDNSIDPPRRDIVYRTVQEGLNNAIRHARPTWIAVAVGPGEEEAVTVEVRNDGASASSHIGSGLGLVGMRERIEAAGGELIVSQSRGEIWTIQTRLPRQRTSAVLDPP